MERSNIIAAIFTDYSLTEYVVPNVEVEVMFSQC